jgi:H+/gluconate symporter-like permease
MLGDVRSCRGVPVDDSAHAVLSKTPVGLVTGGTWVLLNHTASVAPLLAITAATLGLFHASRSVGTGIGPYLWTRWLSPLGERVPLEVTTVVTALGALTFIARMGTRDVPGGHQS